ncbi:cupin domain-containing protein [Amycolatopsis ultiminotia]|uniref:Cupin domain-containing protein n=1 Tax=Amycolatopsis ultiminotia TaxID=543629 RepID=A0ABP6YS60_9PSEU
MTIAAQVEAEAHHYAPDGTVINSRLPLLVYRQAVQADAGEALETTMKRVFARNDWLNNWTYRGVYPYPHFHSTCHEVLGVVRGAMPLRLGGAAEEPMLFLAGDVIVLPAGVSHSAFEDDQHTELGGTEDVLMVGGYADGRDWDLMRDGQYSDEELRAAVKRIMSLPIPRLDPVTGEPMQLWREAPPSLEWGQSVGKATGIEDIHK